MEGVLTFLRNLFAEQRIVEGGAARLLPVTHRSAASAPPLPAWAGILCAQDRNRMHF